MLNNLDLVVLDHRMPCDMTLGRDLEMGRDCVPDSGLPGSTIG